MDKKLTVKTWKDIPKHVQVRDKFGNVVYVYRLTDEQRKELFKGKHLNKLTGPK